MGDARVGLVGFPSVGKSTLLTKITGTFSEAAGYGAPAAPQAEPGVRLASAPAARSSSCGAAVALLTSHRWLCVQKAAHIAVRAHQNL